MLLLNYFHEHFYYRTIGMTCLAAAVLSFSVGLLVLLQKPRSRTHQSFFLITLTGSTWIFLFSILNLVSGSLNLLIFPRLWFLLAVPYISPSVYFFSVSWTGYRQNKYLIPIGYSISFVFAATFFLNTEVLSTVVQHPSWNINFFRKNLFGSLYYYSFLSFFFTYAVLAFFNFYKAWRGAASPKDRALCRNFLIGFLVGYTGSVDFLAARGLDIFPFGHLSFSMFVLIVAYSIVRHRFLEINLVIKRVSLLFFIYSILFAITLPIAFPILSRVLKQSTAQAVFVLGLSLGIGVILSLGPLIYAYVVRHSFWLRGNISTGLTHELKSPLSSIQGALDIALEHLKKPEIDREKALEYLQMIQKNTTRLDGFVKNLLNIAKSEEEAVQITKSVADLPALIIKAVDTFKPVLDQKSLNVSLNLPETLPAEVDQQKIEQVFSNLLSNAIKFSNQGTINLELIKNNSEIHFSIKDQGCGLNPKFTERIFDRFYQVSESSKGAGIGLTIAKAWVEAHGGKIWAESEGEGRGTTVKFTLPTQ